MGHASAHDMWTSKQWLGVPIIVFLTPLAFLSLGAALFRSQQLSAIGEFIMRNFCLKCLWFTPVSMITTSCSQDTLVASSSAPYGSLLCQRLQPCHGSFSSNHSVLMGPSHATLIQCRYSKVRMLEQAWFLLVWMCMRVCVRACVAAFVRARVRACVCAGFFSPLAIFVWY